MSNEKIIFDVQVDTERAQKEAVELQKKLNALRKEQSELKKSQKELDKAFEKGAISAEEYAAETERIAREEINLRKKISETSSELKTQEKVMNTNSNSLKALRMETAKMTKQLSELDTSTEEGAAEFERLTAAVKENTEKIKEAEESYGSFKTNVGNYKNAVTEALQENREMFGSLGQMGGGVADLGKKFLMAAGPIGALVAVVSTLFAAFSRTSGGAVKLEQVMGGLSGVFNSVVGKVGNFVGNIGKLELSLENIGKSIVENLENRLKGVIKTFEATSKAAQALISGDFEKLGEAAADYGNAVMQTATGIEDAGKKAADFFSEAYNDGENLVKMQQNAAIATRALEVETARLASQFEKLSAISDDDTRGFEERKKAMQDAMRVSEELGQSELKLANMRKSLIDAEISMRKKQGLDYRDLLDAQTAAIVEVENKEKELQMRRLNREMENRKMLRDEMEIRLDVLIDGADATKSALEREVAMTNGSYEQRLALLEKLKSGVIKNAHDMEEFSEEMENAGMKTFQERVEKAAKAEKIFREATAQFISEIESFTGKQIDAENLLAEKDEVARERKIRAMQLDEITQTRLIGFIKESTAAEVDFQDMKNDLLDEQIENEKRAAEKRIETEKEVSDEQLKFLQMKSERLKTDSESTLAFLQAEMEKELSEVKHSEELKFEIRQKYAALTAEAQKAANSEMIDATSASVGKFASIMEENTVAYKTLASSEALMNTYTGITAALKLPPPAKYFEIAATAGIGLAQVAKINGLSIFEKGGLAKGPSHRDGGIKAVVGGSQMIEFEGGEFITRKDATAKSLPALSKINSNPNISFDAVPKFEFGGFVASDANAAFEAQKMFMDFPPTVLQVSEYKKVSNRVDVTEKIARA